jgi:hypothetical protein
LWFCLYSDICSGVYCINFNSFVSILFFGFLWLW